MRQAPFLSFLPDLQIPLRDALRGVASLADATEEALEPATKILPEPIRTRFQSAVRAIENAGKSLMAAPIDLEHLRMASDFATGRSEDRAALESCATIICYAWEYLHNTGLTHRHLISETILVGRLSHRQQVSDRAASECAASLVDDIRKSSAIGRMPGVAAGVPADEQGDIDLALVAIVVWLMSARADSMPEEEMLLDLSFALVSAIRDDALGSIDDPAKLAQFLKSASAHL